MAYLDPISLDRRITREPEDWYSDEDAPDLEAQAAQLSDKLDQLMWDMQADYAAEGCFPSEVAARFAKVCRVANKANRRWERRGGGRETEEDYDQIY